jgi:hypothetical protein
MTTRSLTAEAQHFAETAPVQLIDGGIDPCAPASRKSTLLLQTYKARSNERPIFVA